MMIGNYSLIENENPAKQPLPGGATSCQQSESHPRRRIMGDRQPRSPDEMQWNPGDFDLA